MALQTDFYNSLAPLHHIPPSLLHQSIDHPVKNKIMKRQYTVPVQPAQQAARAKGSRLGKAGFTPLSACPQKQNEPPLSVRLCLRTFNNSQPPGWLRQAKRATPQR